MAHRQFGGHVQLGQFLALEGVRVDVGVAGQVQLHVDQRRGQQFGDLEALAEFAGLLDLVDQRLRDWLAGLVVQGELAEHLRGRQPGLMHLARKLDVVAEHPSAGKAWIGDPGVQAVQRVAELVEHGDGVAPGDQHRLAGRAGDEVGVVGDDGGDLAAIGLLGPIGVHPGAGALAGAGIGIEVPKPHMATAALDLIDGDGGVLDRHIGHRTEGEAIQLAGHPMHAVTKLFELQVGRHVVQVEVVPGGAHLLGIVAIVPGGDRDALALLVGDDLHLGHLFPDPGDGRGPDAHHQRHGGLWRIGHGIVGEAPMGVGREPQKLGPLGAQIEDLADPGVVVADVAVVAPAVERLPDLLAQIAAVGIGEEGFR